MGQGQFGQSGQAGQFNRLPQQQSQWQQISALSDRTSKLEETFQQFLQVTISNHKRTEAAIRNWEIQVGQLAKKLEDMPDRSFWANTEFKVKIFEKSEKVLPYPKESDKIEKERQYEWFKDILRQLQITIPLTEALQYFPAYAKHMKQFLTKQRYLDEETVDEKGDCSVIVKKPLPLKVKYPGSFTIPCVIGKENIRKALIELGSSINLMPLSMLKRIGGLEVKPTKVTLFMADESSKKPYDVAEDVV
ncbi:uncharacterized protein LOC124841133, partial [Vigna umbellata]|uniref:uncharacterized protein LOC124841133 n=1 Tax=Vigna umbellata TaxID=87088 RepID=UPI001F5F18A8